jgi:hypothetical protein
MKKLRIALLSLVTLATSLTSFGQFGTNWTPIPWTDWGVNASAGGNRNVHFQQNGPKDNRNWYNRDQKLYAFERTGSDIAGTYEYDVAKKTETFRHYGPYAQSVNRVEIRVQDNYGQGQMRQLEGYVTFNDKLSKEQAFLQIWGWRDKDPDKGATILQLRGKGGIISLSGRAPKTSIHLTGAFATTNFADREFKLNVLHKQETGSGSSMVNGRIEIYVDGVLFAWILDNHFTVDDSIPPGTNYFKYGCYGTVENDETNAKVIWKEALYWKNGNFPGSTGQTITFNQPADIPLNGGDVSPGAISTSGLTVSYRSDKPEIASIVGGKIRPVSTGTAKIWAYQNGSSTHKPAPVVVREIRVVAGGGGTVRDPQTITFPVIPAKLTTDAPFALIATTDSGLTVSYASNNPAVATVGGVSGNIVTIVGPGSANITATQGGDLTYLPADPVTRTLTVTAPRQTQRIDFPAIGQKLVTDPNFNPGATATSGLGVTYTSSNSAVAKIVGDQIDIVGAGTVTITANQAGDASFFPATPVSQTFTVKTPVTYYKIKLRANPTLVLNHVGVPANRAVVNVVTDTGSDNQLWKVIPTTNGYVRIAPLANQAFALDCSDLAPVKGSIVQLWTYDTTNINLRQQWLRSAISGTTAEKVTLRATSTQGAMVLDCEANPAVSGSVVQTWTYKADNTNQRQQWIFEPTVRIE